MVTQRYQPPGTPTLCTSPIGAIRLTCPHTVGMKPLPCGNCEACYWQKRLQAKIRIRARLPGNIKNRWSFLTLTMPSRPGTPDQAMKRWRELRRHISRNWKAGRAWQFVRVTELQDRGAVHFHILHNAPDTEIPHYRGPADNWSKNRFLKTLTTNARSFVRLIESYGFGWVSDNNYVRKSNAAAAEYLAKYLAKNSETSIRRFDGRQVRMLEWSRNWPRERRPPKIYGAEIVKEVTHVHRCSQCRETALGRLPTLSRRPHDSQVRYWQAYKSRIPGLSETYAQILQVRRHKSRLSSQLCVRRYNAVPLFGPHRQDLDPIDPRDPTLLLYRDLKAISDVLTASIRNQGYKGPLEYLNDPQITGVM